MSLAWPRIPTCNPRGCRRAINCLPNRNRMAHALFAHNATSFAIIFVVYFIGLTLIFSALAKLTDWLCRQQVSD